MTIADGMVKKTHYRIVLGQHSIHAAECLDDNVVDVNSVEVGVT
jgi:hypothetical protein